jgi:hypothetical protein
MTAATYQNRAFKIGDGKDIDLNSQSIINLANGINAGDAVNLSQIINPSLYLNAKWVNKTSVTGTWTQYSDAGQTDYDLALTGGVGFIYSVTAANNDELHYGNIVLNAGTYIISVAYIKRSDFGILEILIGTTSLGTIDTYSSSGSGDFNQVTNLTITPATRISGNLRLKVTGKNALSTGYNIRYSRFEIIRKV